MTRRRLTPLLLAVSLCACGEKEAPTQAPQQPLYEAHCKEPLPAFTLGEHSKPTRAQEAALCACIWARLEGWERDVSQKIAQGKEAELSDIQIRGFVPRFGSAIAACGGMKL